MREAWYPAAVRTEYLKFPSGPFLDTINGKGVWHKTQGGDTVLDWYNTSGAIPHFTILEDRGVVHQHYRCDRHSRALRNLRGGVETNRDGAIQVEIVGFSGTDVAVPQLGAITDLAAWLTSEEHVHPSFPMGRLSKPYRRASNSEWDNGVGHFAHGQIPEQDHTDPDLTDATWNALYLGVMGRSIVGLTTAPASVVPSSVMARGSVGDGVVSWQEDLLTLGFPLPKFGADGDFGAETEAATREMERFYRMAIDGVVSLDQAAMGNALATLKRKPPEAPTRDRARVLYDRASQLAGAASSALAALGEELG